MRKLNSPFDGPVAFGAAVQRLELSDHRVLFVIRLLGQLHVRPGARVSVHFAEIFDAHRHTGDGGQR